MTHTQIPALRPHFFLRDRKSVRTWLTTSRWKSRLHIHIFKLESSCWMLKMDGHFHPFFPLDWFHLFFTIVPKGDLSGETMAFVAPSYGGSSNSSAEAKQLMVPVDGRLKMVAKRMLQAGMPRKTWVCGTGFPPILLRILRKWQRILTRLGAFLYHSETGSWYFASFWSVVWTMGDDDHYFHKQMWQKWTCFFPMHQRH